MRHRRGAGKGEGRWSRQAEERSTGVEDLASAPLSPRVPEIGALDLLLSVARLGSLGQAARQHGISQPAAGSRIRHLEGLLGLPLIERSAAGSRLTHAGAMVADWARPVVTAATPLVARERGSGTRYALEAVLDGHGVLAAAPLVELSSTTAIKAAAEAGIGPAVLSSLTVADEVARGQLIALPVAGVDLTRTLRAVWPAGQALTGMLRDVLAVATMPTREPPG